MKYRKMAVSGPAAGGEWDEFDGDTVDISYFENIISSAEYVIEVFRNGGWRKASWRQVEDERAYVLEIERLESSANGLRAKAQHRREKGQVEVEAAREGLRQAEERLQAAVAEAEQRQAAAAELDARAGEIEKQVLPLRADLDARLLAKDRAEDEAFERARKELAKAGTTN